MSPLDDLLVDGSCTIREAMGRLDRNGKGIVLVVDAGRHLLDTITDGDLRRAILRGIKLGDTVTEVSRLKQQTSATPPVTAPAGMPPAQLLHLMNERVLRQVPLIDAEGRVVDVAFLGDLAKDVEEPLKAVVMAGGFGRRLYPLTKDTPKPMLPVGSDPLLAHIVKQLQQSGIQQVHITTHFKGDDIKSYFGNGDRYGMQIQYVEEEKPLGTAGALRLLGEVAGPLLVVNGDILCAVDYRSMLRFHRDHAAQMTVAVKKYDVEVPFGVVDCEGTAIRRIVEKPVYDFFVNAGIYLIDPPALQLLPAGRSDMTDLIGLLVKAGQTVAAFPIVEYWLDVGRQDDYARAQRDAAAGTWDIQKKEKKHG